MKYYTKEWYDLMQEVHVGTDFKKIPDGPYSDREIRAFYQKALTDQIESDRACYDELPELWIPEALYEEPFVPEEWPVIHEDDTVTLLSSAKEVEEKIIADYQAQKAEFDGRPPFDPEESREIFRAIYRAGLRNAVSFYPKWLSETVDKRLIALGLLPETAYRQYKKEMRAKKRRWQRICDKGDAALKAQQIPEKIRQLFSIHDACLLSLKKEGDDLTMTARKDGHWPDGKCYRQLTFGNARVLEKDSCIRIRREEGEYGCFSNVSFLYNEIYKIDGGYEIHFLLWAGMKLGYMTIRCSSVSGSDSRQWQ